MHRHRLLALAALAGLCAAAPAVAAPRRPAVRLSVRPTTTWVPDGQVTSVVRFGPRLIIAGDFTWIGQRTGPLVRVTRSAGRLHAGFPVFAGGEVTATLADGHGGWYVGGDFGYADGRPVSGLAHVLASGRVDPAFAPRPSGRNGEVAGVTQLALAGGALYVAGDFDRIGGAARYRLAAIDAVTGRATAFAPALADASVAALAVRGTTLYVGGVFTRIAGAARASLAAFDTATGALLPWAPALSARGTSFVAAFAVSPTAVYVGGDFDAVDGQPRSGLAAFDAATGSLLAWDPANAARRTTSALAVAGSTIYSAEIGPAGGEEVLAYGADASIRWTLETDGGVDALAVDGGALYLAGTFQHVGHARIVRAGVAAVDAGTRRVLPFAPAVRFAGASGGTEVRVVQPAPDGVLVGGAITTIGGHPRRGLAAVDPASGTPSGWAPNPDGFVRALAVSGDRLYVAGSFRHLSGARRAGSAAYGPRLHLTGWRLGGGISPGAGAVTSLVVSGRHVVATGFFSGLPLAMRVAAAFDRETGALDRGFAPGLAARGMAWRALASGDRLVVLGDFPNRVAVLDARTGRVRSYPVRATGGPVTALALHGDTLYAGGSFTRVAGRRRRGLAAVSLRTGAVLGWRPSVDGPVFSMATDGWTVVIAGGFRHVGKTPQRWIAALAARGPALVRFDPKPSEPPLVTLDWSSVLLYGSFRAVGAVPQAHLAALRY